VPQVSGGRDVREGVNCLAANGQMITIKADIFNPAITAKMYSTKIRIGLRISSTWTKMPGSTACRYTPFV